MNTGCGKGDRRPMKDNVIAADCRETLSNITLPYLEEQIEAMSRRIYAALSQADVTDDDTRAFVLRCLAEAHECLPEDMELGEMVIRRAVSASSLQVALNTLKLDTP